MRKFVRGIFDCNWKVTAEKVAVKEEKGGLAVVILAVVETVVRLRIPVLGESASHLRKALAGMKCTV